MSKSEGDVQVITKVQPRVEVAPPQDFKVIYMNDEVTTMDFVISSLMEVFDHDHDRAMGLMKQVHEEGSAIVAVLPYEIAEHKGVEVTVQARAQGFPLEVRVVPENS